MKCIMLSLDTSSTATGISIWENGNHLSTIEINEEYHQRIKKNYFREKNNFDDMILSFLDVIKPFNVSIIVVEKPVIERNPKTQSTLDRIVGFIEGYSTIHNIDFVEYRPSVWRSLVKEKNERLPRKREGLKAWAISKAKELTGLDMTDNMAESYLIGLAHINYWKQLENEQKL